jgi:hypothetical protein
LRHLLIVVVIRPTLGVHLLRRHYHGTAGMPLPSGRLRHLLYVLRRIKHIVAGLAEAPPAGAQACFHLLGIRHRVHAQPERIGRAGIALCLGTLLGERRAVQYGEGYGTSAPETNSMRRHEQFLVLISGSRIAERGDKYASTKRRIDPWDQRLERL